MNFTTTNEEEKIVPQVEQGREKGKVLSELTMKIMTTLKDMLPYLDTNLELSNTIYVAGAINKNEWDLIKNRHKDANVAVSSIDFEHGELSDPNLGRFEDYEKRLCDAACWTIIDMRDVLLGDDFKGAEKESGMKLSNALVSLLQQAGYTAKSELWNIPALPTKRK